MLNIQIWLRYSFIVLFVTVPNSDFVHGVVFFLNLFDK